MGFMLISCLVYQRQGTMFSKLILHTIATAVSLSQLRKKAIFSEWLFSKNKSNFSPNKTANRILLKRKTSAVYFESMIKIDFYFCLIWHELYTIQDCMLLSVFYFFILYWFSHSSKGKLQSCFLVIGKRIKSSSCEKIWPTTFLVWSNSELVSV